ncbi:MAG TPA: ribonuclease P protein component [Candidatus Saccharibacteria bacterium]|nr:ribonuclease P protein component [Candidatus Saccharibacteria bacterium]
MLSYKYRFHGHASLKYVFANGQTVRHRWFTIKYCPNPRRKQSRVSVVVSKKVCKGAVGRNRIRRRLYEEIRRNLGSTDQSIAYDIVVIVTLEDVRTVESSELSHELQVKMTEAGLYKLANS